MRKYLIIIGFFCECISFISTGFFMKSDLSRSFIALAIAMFFAVITGRLIGDEAVNNFKLKKEVKNV